MTHAEAICQEFCDRIQTSVKTREVDYQPQQVEEIKCALHKTYFPELFKRMKKAGYTCTQVQNHARFKRCVVWFEPTSDEE